MTNKSMSKPNNRGSVLSLVLVLLVVFQLVSLSMLITQLATYSRARPRNYISLTEPSANTSVTVSKPPRAALASENGGAMAVPVVMPLAASFKAYDKDTVWQAKTDVEIFSVRHDNNGDAVFTVQTSNGDKVIAPGTNGVYEFALKNDGDVSLDYTLKVQSYFVGKGVDGSDLRIPVDARFSGRESGYIVGSESEWPEVERLNEVDRSGKLSPGNISDYKLEWRWPFERTVGEGLPANDSFDTALGNLAVDESLELHIVIMTTAEQGEGPGGYDDPITGDESDLTLWIVLAAASLVLIILLILGSRRDKKNEAASK